MSDAIVWVLLSIGVAAQLSGVLGILVARSVFDRLHLTGPASIFGPSCLALAVVIGLVLGVAAAAITLLALAALPSDRGPNRVAELVASRRVDMMVAGAFALLFVTVVYFVGMK